VLGAYMGIIPSTDHISAREENFYGHQRVYTLGRLEADIRGAGLKTLKSGGILYKPLPNEMLGWLCKKMGREWQEKFLEALIKFGENRSDECANIYVVCN
jgi:hypothetical protein